MPELTGPAPALWPADLRPGALRWVRSSTHFEDTVAFYRDLVGLPVVDSFRDSYGEDGVSFGLPGIETHMEIVRSQEVEARTDRFDQMVFYLTGDDALTQAVAPLVRAGVARDPAPHP
jgi:hypothetical protein